MLDAGQIRQAIDQQMTNGAALLTQLADQGATDQFIWHCRDLADQLDQLASNLRDDN